MTGVETSESRRFAIIGVAGYIAPRHLNAMRSLGCDLVAAHDVFDSVGMIDGYFPRAYFTTDPDDFRRRMVAGRAEFLTVCTPNYLHCTHTVTGLEAGLDVICEKPLALTPGRTGPDGDLQPGRGQARIPHIAAAPSSGNRAAETDGRLRPPPDNL